MESEEQTSQENRLTALDESMNYNLLEEKWIPVLWKDGDTNPVSIIEALTKAGFIPAAKACLCAVDEEVLQVKLTLKIQ